jgi:predicted aldo/keto reductase-like oxidoreductase
MSERANGIGPVNRRDFLQTGAAAAATAVSLATTTPGLAAQAPEAKKADVLPRRPLGKTGIDVTILNYGTFRGSGLDRLLRFVYANGVRYVDTAKSYGTEPAVGKWLQALPEVRKEVFLVTKDSPHTPSQMPGMLDERLKTLGVDYVDMFFIHALGDHHSLDDAVSIASGKGTLGKEFREAADAIRKSGKAKFIGFSTHHVNRPAIIQAAAEGGIVDAIMVAYVPWLEKDAPLNRALDAAHAKGIGLISMKQVAGNSNILQSVPQHVPTLKEKGLSPYQGLLHAIWTDERISTCCISMRNVEQVREDSEAARKFEPLKAAEMRQLRDALLAAGPTFCANCDGSCSRAAGTDAAFGELTRALTYYEHHGCRGEAHKLYASLTEAQRDWSTADLEAAREACHNKLDFAKLLARVDRTFA